MAVVGLLISGNLALALGVFGTGWPRMATMTGQCWCITTWCMLGRTRPLLRLSVVVYSAAFLLLLPAFSSIWLNHLQGRRPGVGWQPIDAGTLLSVAIGVFAPFIPLSLMNSRFGWNLVRIVAAGSTRRLGSRQFSIRQLMLTVAAFGVLFGMAGVVVRDRMVSELPALLFAFVAGGVCSMPGTFLGYLAVMPWVPVVLARNGARRAAACAVPITGTLIVVGFIPPIRAFLTYYPHLSVLQALEEYIGLSLWFIDTTVVFCSGLLALRLCGFALVQEATERTETADVLPRDSDTE